MIRLNSPSVVAAILFAIVSLVGLAAMPMTAMAEENNPCDQIKVVGVELERLGKTLQTETDLNRIEEAMREAPGEPWELLYECRKRRWETTSGMEVDAVPLAQWGEGVEISLTRDHTEDGALYHLDFKRSPREEELGGMFIRVLIRNRSDKPERLALRVTEYCRGEEMMISPLMTPPGERERFMVPLCDGRWRFVRLKPAIAAPTTP